MEVGDSIVTGLACYGEIGAEVTGERLDPAAILHGVVRRRLCDESAESILGVGEGEPCAGIAGDVISELGRNSEPVSDLYVIGSELTDGAPPWPALQDQSESCPVHCALCNGGSQRTQVPEPPHEASLMKAMHPNALCPASSRSAAMRHLHGTGSIRKGCARCGAVFVAFARSSRWFDPLCPQPAGIGSPTECDELFDESFTMVAGRRLLLRKTHRSRHSMWLMLEISRWIAHEDQLGLADTGRSAPLSQSAHGRSESALPRHRRKAGALSKNGRGIAGRVP